MFNAMISYSHEDRQYADKMVDILEKNNIKCWIDYRDATPGNNYAGSIVHAIKNSDFVIVIISINSMTSPQVLSEINSAVNHKIKILPFRIDTVEFNDNFEYYLGRTHWLDATTQPIEPHIYHLAKTINGYSPEVKTAPEEHHSTIETSSQSGTDKRVCKMVKYDDLIDMGYTSAKIAIQLVENDYINWNGIDENNEGSAEQWEIFLRNNSETFQYLINSNGEIVGDWSIVALTDEAYDDAQKGELLENDLSGDNTELICFPGEYNGYILTFTLLPDYRTMKNYNLIIDSFFKQLELYSEQGIFFKHWCINVFGKETEALVKSLGFTYVCNNKVFGKIYTCSFNPLPNISVLKKFPNLVKNYEEK